MAHHAHTLPREPGRSKGSAVLTRVASVLLAVVIPLAASVAAAGCDDPAGLRAGRRFGISARPAAGASIEMDTGDRPGPAGGAESDGGAPDRAPAAGPP